MKMRTPLSGLSISASTLWQEGTRRDKSQEAQSIYINQLYDTINVLRNVLISQICLHNPERGLPSTHLPSFLLKKKKMTLN